MFRCSLAFSLRLRIFGCSLFPFFPIVRFISPVGFSTSFAYISVLFFSFTPPAFLLCLAPLFSPLLFHFFTLSGVFFYVLIFHFHSSFSLLIFTHHYFHSLFFFLVFFSFYFPCLSFSRCFCSVSPLVISFNVWSLSFLMFAAAFPSSSVRW